MSRNIANILWTKAYHDFNAGSRIADADPEDIGDQVLGLLLQQSVEKATKALITAKHLKYSHTHDIHHLFQLLAKKIDIPQQFQDLIGLSMFATGEKYESPIIPNQLNKQDLLKEVKAFLEWVEGAGNFNQKTTMEKWICCGHDIRALCEKATTSLPARCFFCGEPRKTVALTPQPEDSLAFELAEIWCGKIREYHGDPETHVPSLDQYGRTDIEAWRAVARHVLKNPSTPHSKFSPANESEFVVFTVRENNQRVGTIALLPSWSENDVMIELQSRRYSTGGRVKFDGWPSTSKFKLEIEGDELHVFHFERKT